MASLEHSCYRFGDEPIGCPKCSGNTVKNGKIQTKQQYKCKKCNKRFQLDYTYKACEPRTSPNFVALIKEGCGIRSIARLLNISASTVLVRIRKIAAKIEQPAPRWAECSISSADFKISRCVSRCYNGIRE